MTPERVDFFVIGGGSGGVRAARVAATLGASVALAEDKALGGTCVNVGCIPKKLFVYASHVPHAVELARSYGWSVDDPKLDWARLRDAKDREIERLNGVYARILETAGVQIVRGRARLLSPTMVAVGDRVFEARHILVATGGKPIVRKFPGAERAMTSDDVFHLPELPRRVLVVGGGYIAAEFACIFHGLGVETTLSYRGALFLRGFDHEAREHVATEMRRRGITLWFDNEVASVEKNGGELRIQTADGRHASVDAVLCATGRQPNVAGLDLEHAGVELSERGAIVVDDDYATRVPSIHAVGDVVDKINLTPVALAQGAYVAKRLFGGGASRVDLELVPTAIFTQPALASVGLTEEEARAGHHGDIDVYASTFRPLPHTLGGSDERSLVKVIVARETDRVLGVVVVGADAGEIVQAAAIALRAGATKGTFDSTIGIHPTVAEELVSLRTPRS